MIITRAIGRFMMPLLLLLHLQACRFGGERTNLKSGKAFTLYSAHVGDSWQIHVQKPLDYSEKATKRYPVVVLTDANFYYPMLAPVLHQYEKAGRLPPLILVGIGYRSLEEMDSLRVRDYLYPAAIESDEMQTDGGGKKFYHFIVDELLPKIDTSLRTNESKTLLGHSFGGYFSLFTLLEQTKSGRMDFDGFVSGSPTLWYNDFYLSQLPAALKERAGTDTTHLFLSVGGLEDASLSVAPFKELTGKISEVQSGSLICTSHIYNELDHMDIGLLTFLKALGKIYNEIE